jgi:hypothetical protein
VTVQIVLSIYITSTPVETKKKEKKRGRNKTEKERKGSANIPCVKLDITTAEAPGQFAKSWRAKSCIPGSERCGLYSNSICCIPESVSDALNISSTVLFTTLPLIFSPQYNSQMFCNIYQSTPYLKETLLQSPTLTLVAPLYQRTRNSTRLIPDR